LITWPRRICAIVALLAYLAAIVFLPIVLFTDVVALAVVSVLAVVAFVAAWLAISRGGLPRLVGVVALVAALVLAGVELDRADAGLGIIGLIVIVAIATGAARLAVGARAPHHGHRAPTHSAAEHPVLLVNPKSGDGKAEENDLIGEAKRRGIEVIEIADGVDCVELLQDAVRRGADALGAATGDGGQALVASIAVEHDLPFVCVPSGTRNHFALDLGVDRNDVVGALDAFVTGTEHQVYVAWMNDRLFVNNATMGVYATVVQSPEYRDAKVGTFAKMLPELVGPDAEPVDLELLGPDGEPLDRVDLLLVSNNVYELAGPGGFGTRAHLDEGVLGIVTLRLASVADAAGLIVQQATGGAREFEGWQEWTATEFEVTSNEPLDVGIDGEALCVDGPVRFRIDPGALRVWVAPHHPGESPARLRPKLDLSSLARLARIAAQGLDPKRRD
jgi:diacylglycerol kinase family enzyme